jgi:hypothetical protein
VRKTVSVVSSSSLLLPIHLLEAGLREEITDPMADGIQRPGTSFSRSDGEPHSEYWIDPEKALVFIRFARKLIARDIESHATALKQDPLFDPNISEIIDLPSVEEIEITPAQAIALADAIDLFALSAWRAFVVGNDLQANAARTHQMLRSPARNITIFDTLDKAEEWLRAAHPQPTLTNPVQVLPFPSHPRP